jgi:hypothetical protein
MTRQPGLASSARRRSAAPAADGSDDIPDWLEGEDMAEDRTALAKAES